MGSILISLLPYIIGSALVPLQIMIALLLLKSPDRGLLKASAYVVGMTTTRLLQGAVFSFVFTEAALPESGKRPVVSTLLLVLGILLLTTAYKKLQGGDDPDAPPPKWLMLLDQATPLKALGIGLGLPLVAAKLWVFTLSALATISAAQLGQPSSTIAFFLFILFAESLLILPIIFRIVMPVRSKTTLAQFSAWLNQNNRAIVIVVSFVFGGWFLYSGIDGLIQ